MATSFLLGRLHAHWRRIYCLTVRPSLQPQLSLISHERSAHVSTITFAFADLCAFFTSKLPRQLMVGLIDN